MKEQSSKQYVNTTPLPTVGLVFLLLGGTLYAFSNIFLTGNDTLRECYVALTLEGLFFIVVLVLKYQKSGLYIFDPFAIITLLYILLFFVAPLMQFPSGSTARYGVDVSSYCMQATMVMLLGYTAFFFVYEARPLKEKIKNKKNSVFKTDFDEQTTNKLLKWAFAMWTVTYALCVLSYLFRGYDIAYILTGGFGSGIGNEIGENRLSFLGYLKYSLVGCWMFLFVCGKRKSVKVILFCLTIAILFLDGGRAAMIIPLLAPIVYVYTKRKTSPRIMTIAMFILALILLFAVMQVVRAGVRGGLGFDLSGQTMSSLFEPFRAEIEDYKAYYILFNVVPEQHDFLYGSQMILYSFVLLIPRALWPGKPEPQIYEIVRLSFGDQAVVNGVAYPAIGEYYVEFGILGCIVCMAILGSVTKRLRNCYLDADKKSLSIILYSLVYPSLIQIVIRGYFPQNFSMLLFLLAPILILYLRAQSSFRKRELTRVMQQ